MTARSAWLAVALATGCAPVVAPSDPTTPAPPVISSTHSTPPGAPFSRWAHHEQLDLLRANQIGDDRESWRRATRDTPAIVRAAALALLAESPIEADRPALEAGPAFDRGLGDPDAAVREVALVELEELRDRRSADVLARFVATGGDDNQHTRARTLLAALRAP